jgi:Ca2+/Na+ antiporter
MILVGIGFSYVANMIGGQKEALPAAAGLVYVLMALLYLFPSLYLHRYASAIKTFLGSKAGEDMEAALAHQKSFWKFLGIMALIMFGLSILAIGAAILIPLLAKMKLLA